MPLQMIEKRAVKGDTVYQVGLIPVQKGLIILVTDDQFSIGSIAVAVPSADPVSSSAGVFPVIGARNEYSAKVISEKITRKSKRIVLAIVRLKQETYENLQAVLELIDLALEDLVLD